MAAPGAELLRAPALWAAIVSIVVVAGGGAAVTNCFPAAPAGMGTSPGAVVPAVVLLCSVAPCASIDWVKTAATAAGAAAVERSTAGADAVRAGATTFGAKS